MRGFRTSYTGMFETRDGEGKNVDSIEIPVIQRDYAQGRRDSHAEDVRGAFLDTLHAAVTTGPSVGLDFIYGESRDGVFEPLDGQQRLTTLFLLHWYLAVRTGNLDATQRWTRLTYATRPSARRFCDQLVANPPPADLVGPPSQWITDQSWYLHLWRFDPTVDAMLVMIDAIAERFADTDPGTAWGALTSADEPAVWFHLLPVADMGAADDLYIKMNSRGKPLTEFEAFKAHLGQVIEHTGRTAEFGWRIDGPWTDLLWPYRGDNDIVDDEFVRYFDFVLEICEWRDGRVRTEEQSRLEWRAERLFSPENERHGVHLDFLFAAFDAWPTGGLDIMFESLFATERAGSGLRLFGPPEPNLFVECCRRYGEMRGKTRAFSLTDTLLLYAVLLHRIEGTDDVERRLRVIRNVNEASDSELRLENMPRLVTEVTDFMRTGDLSTLRTYNQNQVVDEQRKSEFRCTHPDLSEAVSVLEDHPILRGTLAAFDLDDEIVTRADTFHEVFAPENWPTLTAALLAIGEYQRDYPKWDYHRFGSPKTESVWRELLVGRGDPESLARTGDVVIRLLDRIAADKGPVSERLNRVITDFLEQRRTARHFDWRYYLVNYDWMREGRSGIYYGADRRLGYQMTMLDKTVQRSYYRDAYLYAMWREAGSPDEVEDPWFYGYSTHPRWMRLVRSAVGLRSVDRGIAISNGLDEYRSELSSALNTLEGIEATDAGHILVVPQEEVDGVNVDTRDRVQMGAELLTALVGRGM